MLKKKVVEMKACEVRKINQGVQMNICKIFQD